MDRQSSGDGTLRIVLIVLAVLVLFPAIVMAVGAPMMGMMGWGWTGGMPGPFSRLWVIAMGLFWLVVLAVLGYLLYRGVSEDGGRAPADDPAMEELRLAYARGDLTDEEFDARRERLRREE